MRNEFRKLMIEQVQEDLNDFLDLTKKPVPKKGWAHVMRIALGMPRRVLATRIGCSQNRIASIEQREARGTATLDDLAEIARAMNCKLVYSLVPIEPIEVQLKKQARIVAKARIRPVNHSMILSGKGLTPTQLQREEDSLVQELLNGNPRDLWDTDLDL